MLKADEGMHRNQMPRVGKDQTCALIPKKWICFGSRGKKEKKKAPRDKCLEEERDVALGSSLMANRSTPHRRLLRG